MVEALATRMGDDAINDDIYDLIDKMIQRKAGGRRVGRAHAKAIFEAVVEMMFTHALKTGQFRFPKGFGSLFLRTLSPTRKKLPNGEWINLPGDRAILRYNEGLTVREMLGKKVKEPHRRKTARKSALPENDQPATTPV